MELGKEDQVCSVYNSRLMSSNMKSEWVRVKKIKFICIQFEDNEFKCATWVELGKVNEVQLCTIRG